MSFSFSFAGDDIDTSNENTVVPTAKPSAASAFPIAGKALLPPTLHPLTDSLPHLPSKIAYCLLPVTLDDGSTINLPRRELWDVRVQLMAEEGDGDQSVNEDGSGLGSHDVKTGVYEGGFKSWESSIDLVKVIASPEIITSFASSPLRIIELGCGTALPSLSIFQTSSSNTARTFIMADYNPTVLQHVTLPNFILSWALAHASSISGLEAAFSIEDELELTPELLSAFQAHLTSSNTFIYLLSGAWGNDFTSLLSSLPRPDTQTNTLIIGAETIYSPFALSAFTDTLFSILQDEKDAQTVALIGAKKLYFGVGGSLDDFVSNAEQRGANITYLREETDGVRRGVVKCTLST